MPEVEDPPDFPETTSHLDVPRIKRVMDAYLEQNPQVRQVSGPTARERDATRWENTPEDGLEHARANLEDSEENEPTRCESEPCIPTSEL